MNLFPSPIGELHFSIRILEILGGYSKVSVPYRGATFLNEVRKKWKDQANSFPSPIGELHFSILLPQY